MEPLVVQVTDETPEINFNPDENTFIVHGVSLPEDVKTFYEPVIDWVDQYAQNPNPETVIDINLTYFNTASSKMLHDMLMVFDKIHQAGNSVAVQWNYYEEDEDMEETGEMYQLDVQFPIKLQPYSE